MTETFSCFLSYPKNPEHRTVWHPPVPLPLEACLVRGSWETEEEAHAWAREKGVHPDTYEVRKLY